MRRQRLREARALLRRFAVPPSECSLSHAILGVRERDGCLPLAVPGERVEEFCCRNHIRKLSFFGSVLTRRFRPDSDVDVLVEFHPDHVPCLITLAGMEIELSQILGRKVDLRTAEDLSRYFRDEVVNSALVQ